MALEIEAEHPIPQQISSYQFRLVGDMTLKQFFQVAGGALVALIIYATNINPVIKWPLILFSFLFGVALAFFPLQDRPLATWILLFIKSIYSPTFFVWKITDKKRQFFQPEVNKLINQQPTPEEIVEALDIDRTSPDKSEDILNEQEEQILQKIQKQFDNKVPTKASNEPPAVRLDKLRDVDVPEKETVKVEKSAKAQTQEGVSQAQENGAIPSISPFAAQKVENAKQAMFSSQASPPIPPTKPNIVVGQVMDADGKIIENAILEIRDKDGRPVRALKSNQLGHFMIVTPLLNGKYEIITEKENYDFDAVSFDAKGQIIPPIAIWAKRQDDNTPANNNQNQQTVYQEGAKQ